VVLEQNESEDNFERAFTRRIEKLKPHIKEYHSKYDRHEK
jgi:hypothetical protein